MLDGFCRGGVEDQALARQPPDRRRSCSHGVRKPFRQEAVITEDLWVDPSVEDKGVDVGEEGVEEVLTGSFALVFVENSTKVNVFHGAGENPDPHAKRFLSSCFAVSQSAILS